MRKGEEVVDLNLKALRAGRDAAGMSERQMKTKPRPLTGAFSQDNPSTHACPSGNLFLRLAFPDLTFFGKVILWQYPLS